jgi:alkanesulfonate monooxygenase SsuD/methylene tetrahydromethanopterin reductase-like flavin-dependent oxidoreductase (luciferase family)
MVVAQVSWDLQRFAKGRFFLGLGSQVRKHNEERFSVMDRAVARMREYIQVLRAIWDRGRPAPSRRSPASTTATRTRRRSSTPVRRSIRAF